MEGVEILSSVEVEVAWVFNWQVAVMAFLILLIGVLVFGYCVDKEEWLNIFLPIGLALGLWAGLITGAGFQVPTEYAMEHKIIISEEVSLQDFIEKYEIVGQEGKMYIVREK